MKLIITALPLLFASLAFAEQLQIAPNVRVLSHNGMDVPAYQQSLDLQAGPQVLFIRYEELFDYSSEDHELIRSGVQIIKFDAVKQQSYRLFAAGSQRFDIVDAQHFADAPTFILTDQSQQEIQHGYWSKEQLLTEILSNYR
ncbi:DUF2057 family protein [uncultured Ferrimonas sp.]|uniref:DUF2057 family protein n=1 Tax=uncultured Ferrimonas sp. TaxID=432640 RepID=UPI00260A7A30|nr:DUF2057 family protein [uncultured Ferrimonas sp.]